MPTKSHASILEEEKNKLDLDEEHPGTALSISGGGIRSATFSLGVIQALARLRLLKFDYLSTVSGGGYIGGWLTAWKHREKSMDSVIKSLQGDESTPQDPSTQSPSDKGEAYHEIRPIAHLRRYSNYLTPRLGIASFDFWAVLATVFRNILVNWSVLIPFLLVVLALPRIYIAAIAFPDHYFFDVIYQDGATLNDGNYTNPYLDSISQRFTVSYLIPGLAIFLFAFAQSNILRYLPGVGHVQHTQRDYFSWVLTPLLASVFLLSIWNSVYFSGTNPGMPGWRTYSAGGLLSLLLMLAMAFASGVRPNKALIAPALLTFFIPAIWAWLVFNFILWDGAAGEAVFSYWSWPQYGTYSIPLVLVGVNLGISLVASTTSDLLGEEDREWLARANGGIMIVSLLWFFLSFAVLIGPLILLTVTQLIHDSADHIFTSLFSSIGVVLGWVVSRWGKSTESSGDKKDSATGKLLTGLATLLFLFILVVSLSLLTNALLRVAHEFVLFRGWDTVLFMQFSDPASGVWHRVDTDSRWWQLYRWNDHQHILVTSNPIVLFLVVSLLAVLSYIYGILVNANVFSLQGMYRNRLIRAYLGASNVDRRENDFTGFDPKDDLKLHELDPNLKPFHVINLTLNLVDGRKLEWQQRKASSFVATPLHCGNKNLGYRDSRYYGGRDGISLGEAIATSGAAASPNMGYHTTPILAFIMTLFNARLGIWLGNPRDASASARSAPRSALTSLVGEAMGHTTATGKYIYLSDGGHFENLALYEMVARRCSDILIIDSGCDPETKLEDLGNATRKISIDQGVELEFFEGHLQKIRNKSSRFALAHIRYNNGNEDGRLIYVKPVVLGDESPSISSYAAVNPSFPHESTSDQWFSESQTESYRLLGWTTMMEIAAGFKGNSMPELFEYLSRQESDASAV